VGKGRGSVSFYFPVHCTQFIDTFKDVHHFFRSASAIDAVVLAEYAVAFHLPSCGSLDDERFLLDMYWRQFLECGLGLQNGLDENVNAFLSWDYTSIPPENTQSPWWHSVSSSQFLVAHLVQASLFEPFFLVSKKFGEMH